ncbi:MAG: LysM peptidoglycan-binding domain-containing protein [Nitrospinales bacterium]
MATKLQIHWILLQFFILSFLASPLEAKLTADKHSLGQYHFSVPAGLQTRVDFWKKVYSQYTTNHAIVHDINNLSIIYEVVNLSGEVSERAKEKKREQIKSRYKKILRSLARKKPGAKLTAEEGRVARLVKKGYYRASRNIRVQIGQKDRFREGLARSGQYISQILKVFKDYGLPQELTVLPHVESSFQLNAYSSAGAAGVWQFTRRTGRRYLKVGYEVDERMDPLLATVAAAKLLKRNFEHLKSWPLAITAYNHGLQGMKRAKRLHGANLARIISRYRSRTFGFASQNFYSEFLAALDVVRNYQKYFPGLKINPPLRTASVAFRHYVDVRTVMKYFNMTAEEINSYNYSLRRPVLSGQKRIPKGFIFKAPAEKFPDIERLYAQIPKSLKHHRQISSKWYTVRRGDTLSRIAARFRTRVGTLKRLNRIGRRSRIYVGQVLRLPQSKRARRSPVQVAGSQPVNVTGLKTVSYRVRRHDNLFKIAQRFRTDQKTLVALNRMKDPDYLYPGQVLQVPKRASSSIRVVKKTDHLVIKSTNGEKSRPARSDVTLKFVNNEIIRGSNQNRPAFLPVSFTPNMHKDSKVGDITVDLGETLSHYSEWADLTLEELLRINHRKNGTLKFHEKIKVPFYRVSPAEFETRRQEYHKAIQEDFFSNYRIKKTLVRKIKKGETLWEISNDIYFVPFWLLSYYNPDRDINSLSVGDSVVIPLITKVKPS